MKKVISQISLILIIMIIGMISVFMPEAYGAESQATINCPSTVILGKDFSVTLQVPDNVYGANAEVMIKFSNGTMSKEKISYIKDMTGFSNSVSLNAKVEGQATISITSINLADVDGKYIEKGTSKSVTITIKKEESNTPTTPTTPSEPSGGNTGSSGNTDTGNSNSGNSNSNTGTSGNTGNSGTTQTPKFTDVNETVYTTTRCNLRESYSTSSNKVAVVNEGTKLTRKGVGDNGWSKVEYNGKTVYVSSQYVTTTAPKDEEEPEEEEKEVIFKDTHENLYAKQSCNLRASWSTESEKVGYLTKGQAVERTGYAENGWSRILYNGKTVYVASRLLSVEKPEEDPAENTINENTVTNSVVNNTITNEVVDPTQMSEEDRLKELEEEIGVLPEVGINAANIAYVIVTIMAICGLVAGIVYMKKIK